MNRHANPLRLIRNIRRIVDVNKVSKRSIKDNKSKKRYLVPLIKNTILVIIAITLAETIRINAIARCLPLSVSDKQKQKRLLRFLDQAYPTESVMKQWALFVLRKVYQKTKSKVVLLIDETDLLLGYCHLRFRHACTRLLLLLFHFGCVLSLFTLKSTLMSKSRIYLSHNTLIVKRARTFGLYWAFLDNLKIKPLVRRDALSGCLIVAKL